MDRHYRFGELKAKLHESTNEFKPKFGNGVKGEKEINRKAYDEISKEVKKPYEGMEKNEANNTNAQIFTTRNGMSDLQYDSVDDKFKANAKAGLQGYTSDADKKARKGEALGNASYNDEKFAKQFTDSAKTKQSEQNKESETGLQSRERDKEKTHLHSDVVESKKIPLLKFKKVQFISESQMLAHVPDDYKNEGKRFYMQDHKGNKYLVEWHDKPEVNRLINENKVNEDMDRIKYLFGYKSKESNTNSKVRMNEGANIDSMLGRVRQLMK